MTNIIFEKTLSTPEKIALMQEDARFDVADNDTDCVPDLSLIKTEIKSCGNPPTAPKVFLSNDCIFNCAYCGCRNGRDCEHRYANTPKEMADIAIRTANESGQKVFITSAIYNNPDYTEELIIETMKIMRLNMGYKGYIHAKIMPGTDPELIRKAGMYANRLSVNIEVAQSEGYAKIAKNKNRSNILTPMNQISSLIKAAKSDHSPYAPCFARSQTTQLMAGSTDEDDFTVLNLSKALYQKYDLSRVYYTAFQYRHPAEGYDDLPLISTPKWRMKRLYQADRLMQLYGFTPEEITPKAEPNLSRDLDPKAAWAMRNLHLYPVEVNTADYELLLKIPGIGITYANRIIKARKYCRITHDVLRSLGVSLKRSRHFLLADGKFSGEKSDDPGILYGFLSTPLDDTMFFVNRIEDS